jgi:hypothetical protein
MKRIGMMLLLLGLAGAGCLPMRAKDEVQKPPTTRLKSKDQAPPVMAEDVTQENSAEMVKRMWTEINSEGQKD